MPRASRSQTMEQPATKRDMQASEKRLLRKHRILLHEIRRCPIAAAAPQRSPGMAEMPSSSATDGTDGSSVESTSSDESNHPPESASSCSPLPPHVRALQQQLPFLLREMDVTEDFLDDLVHSDLHVLSESELESVKEAGMERRTEKRRRVVKLLQSKSEEIFLRNFLPTLRIYQSHVADRLEQVYEECKQGRAVYECLFCQLVREVDLKYITDAFLSCGKIGNKMHDYFTCEHVSALDRWVAVRSFIAEANWGEELMSLLIRVVRGKSENLAAKIDGCRNPDFLRCACSDAQFREEVDERSTTIPSLRQEASQTTEKKTRNAGLRESNYPNTVLTTYYPSAARSHPRTRRKVKEAAGRARTVTHRSKENARHSATEDLETQSRGSSTSSRLRSGKVSRTSGVADFFRNTRRNPYR